ncbi:hypothetical protein D3C83_87630 [compost metagenome]
MRSVCVFISSSGGTMSPMSVSMHSTSYASIATRMFSNASRWRSVRADRNSSTDTCCAELRK